MERERFFDDRNHALDLRGGRKQADSFGTAGNPDSRRRVTRHQVSQETGRQNRVADPRRTDEKNAHMLG
jgi:hypothetical protein